MYLLYYTLYRYKMLLYVPWRVAFSSHHVDHTNRTTHPSTSKLDTLRITFYAYTHSYTRSHTKKTRWWSNTTTSWCAILFQKYLSLCSHMLSQVTLSSVTPRSQWVNELRHTNMWVIHGCLKFNNMLFGILFQVFFNYQR